MVMKLKLLCVFTAIFLVFSTQISVADQPLTPLQLLGQKIFNDKNLSEPAGQACASCHEESKAFTGNAGSSIAAIAQGSTPEKMGVRNVPTLKYMAYSPPLIFRGEADEKGEVNLVPTGGQFWDGRANSLVDQAHGPLFNKVEMNNVDAAAVAAKIKRSAYAAQFEKEFGPFSQQDAQIILTNAATAVALFESSPRFMPFSSKFDSVLQGTATFTSQEARGFDLFKDEEKGNCLSCHVGKVESTDPTDWLFTDFTYDNLGLPRNKSIPANMDANYFDLGICKQEGLSNKLPPSIELQSLCGAFKVPTLRNIAITAPYFHNGSFSGLRDAVKFYVTRDTNPELWYPKSADGKVQKFNDLPASAVENVNTTEKPYDRKLGETPRLNDEEIDAVVAFLKTLTDKMPE
jgi:cytochrome c peroxidase